MSPFRLSFAILLLPALLGCATSPPPMQCVCSPGVEKIPIGIVLLPLFSTEPAKNTARISPDAGGGYEKYSVQSGRSESHDEPAILIGNAFFASRYSDADTHVTDLYIKMVDVETLEVMCQVAMPYDESGWRVDDVARQVADALACEADLQVSSDQE